MRRKTTLLIWRNKSRSCKTPFLMSTHRKKTPELFDDLANIKNDLKKTQFALDDTEKKLYKQIAQNKKVSDERDGYNQQLQAEKTKTAALTSAKNANDKKILSLNQRKTN
ncbi:hypothetical protein EIN_147030 [Entamoeba invadens IP1]|uniref:Uncharacterized protein n=1 Tax=Entamoeba invadens IP1 TaxID=370355 RepID=L7FLS1_ENTIV|nr:hypothetical protein EIN_147030 [Entamoeba invadens IP1]ELP89075.1 hypothetical protein EIN_147030 [Entamoeba invadens IP1]|eukprot:XP_004255846.1 hypothetical protein EIN_147030 [Entamoeba invadens IP1]